MADMARLIVVNGLQHLYYFALPRYIEYPLFLVVNEKIVVLVVNRLPHLVRMGRFQDNPVGMEYAYPQQLMALSDHLQDYLHILGVADAHGIIDTSLDGLQQKVGALPGGVDKLIPLPVQVKKGKSTDTKRQQADGDENNLGCQAFEYQPASVESGLKRVKVACRGLRTHKQPL
jgi:hypothetical protein